MRVVEDKRAPSMPDVPYSAYCKTCWNPVYVLWMDVDHEGKCMFGKTEATQCPDAINASKNSATMAKMRAGRLQAERG